MNSEARTCKVCQQQFTVEPDDFAFYKKMNVPAPANCPECRFRWRCLWRNETTLYSRTCGLCQKSTLSMYGPNTPYTIYCADCWSSDKWDPFSYGVEYDLTRPFFDQLGELLKKVPKAGIFASSDVGPNINSPYTNFAGGNKDSYLIFNSGPSNENCGYARGIMRCRDTFDAYYAMDIERGYEIVNVHKSSGIAHAQNTNECLNSAYLLNCTGCQDCFGCVNLRGKSHYFLNEPLGKAEYDKRVGEIRGSYQKMREFQEKFEKLALTLPRREHNNLKSVNVVGDYIFESKNSYGFELSLCEDAKYVYFIKLTKGSYDLIGHGRQSELLLEGVAVGSSQRVIGSWWVTGSHDVEYTFAARSSEYCFGCDSVKGAKYTILNKRYSEDEYKKIREHILTELKQLGLYGLYMPPALAPFAYNETIAQDNMPLTKDVALKMGFRWEDGKQLTSGKETLKPEQIPDHIRDVQDSILKETLACISCGRNYRLIPAELQFYRIMTLPIPRQCFYCRHADRLKRRGPMKIYDRECAKCQKAIKTTYAPDPRYAEGSGEARRPEIVYCESCYQKEVI